MTEPRWRRVLDWIMGIRGDYDTEARKILRQSFWIGWDSIWDLSGRRTRQRLDANERAWEKYWADREARECPPVDPYALLDRAIEEKIAKADPSEREELRRKIDEVRKDYR